MEREHALEYLGESRMYFEEIEATFLTEYPEIDTILAGRAVENASFRFYYRKKFIAYLDVHEGYLDLMTRYTAEDIKRVGEVIDGMSDYARMIWRKRYPCGTGAWIHYHVDSDDTRDEALIFLRIKAGSIVKNRRMIRSKAIHQS